MFGRSQLNGFLALLSPTCSSQGSEGIALITQSLQSIVLASQGSRACFHAIHASMLTDLCMLDELAMRFVGAGRLEVCVGVREGLLDSDEFEV